MRVHTVESFERASAQQISNANITDRSTVGKLRQAASPRFTGQAQGVGLALARGLSDPAPGAEQLKEEVLSFLQQFSDHWQKAEQQSEKLIQELPSAVRPYFEAQLLINDLSLKCQLITRAGEAASTALRRVQQMGNG